MVDRSHFRECLMETLSEMFGSTCVNPLIKGDKLNMNVNGSTISVDLNTRVCRNFSVVWYSLSLNECCADVKLNLLFSNSLLFFFVQEVTCEDDESLQQIVHTAVNKLHQAITPAKV